MVNCDCDVIKITDDLKNELMIDAERKLTKKRNYTL